MENPAIRFLKEQHKQVLDDLRREIAALREENKDLQFRLTVARDGEESAGDQGHGLDAASAQIQQSSLKAGGSKGDEVEALRERLAVLEAKWNVLVATTKEKDDEMEAMARRMEELEAQREADQATIRSLQQLEPLSLSQQTAPEAIPQSPLVRQSSPTSDTSLSTPERQQQRSLKPTPPKMPSGGGGGPGPRRSIGFRASLYTAVRRSSEEPGSPPCSAAATPTATAESGGAPAGFHQSLADADLSRSFPPAPPSSRRRLPTTPHKHSFGRGAQAQVQEEDKEGADSSLSQLCGDLHECALHEHGDENAWAAVESIPGGAPSASEMIESSTLQRVLVDRESLKRGSSASRCNCPTRHPVVPPIGGKHK